jgi:hypothetical protein
MLSLLCNTEYILCVPFSFAYLNEEREEKGCCLSPLFIHWFKINSPPPELKVFD